MGPRRQQRIPNRHWAIKGVDAPTAEEVTALWRTDTYKERLLRWFELNCDYAMTLDMPLWVKVPKYADSPFHKCSVELLTDLTVENLQYFADHRGEYDHCNFLNVLQGRTEAEEDYWYGRVRDFDFEGWAIGGSVAGELDLGRVLKRLLVLRDEKLLGGRRDWLHFLGLGQLNWAVALTAIRRAIRGNVGGAFGISFDTASPTMAARVYQNVYGTPTLTAHVKSWKVTTARFPTSYAAAVRDAADPFPPGSPLSSVVTLGDMNPHKGKYTVRRFDDFSHNALTSHKTYVLLAAVRAANHAAFGRGPLPQVLADMIGLVGDLFEREEWRGLLSDGGTRTILANAGLSTMQGEALAA